MADQDDLEKWRTWARRLIRNSTPDEVAWAAEHVATDSDESLRRTLEYLWGRGAPLKIRSAADTEALQAKADAVSARLAPGNQPADEIYDDDDATAGEPWVVVPLDTKLPSGGPFTPGPAA